jgi:hypothetical protein
MSYITSNHPTDLTHDDVGYVIKKPDDFPDWEHIEQNYYDKTESDGRYYEKTTADNKFLHLNGSKAMGADLDLGGNKITNVVDPTAAQEGATKNYIDTNFYKQSTIDSTYYDKSTSDTRFLRTDGNNNMSSDLTFNTGASVVLNDTNMDAGSNQLINVADPSTAQDAMTKNFADSNYLMTSGNNAMTGNLDMGTNKITSLVDPTANQEAATKKYVDDNSADVSTWDQYAASSNVDIGDNKIINCNAPSNNKDVVNLQYFNANNAAEQNLIKQILDYQSISVPKTISGLDAKHYKCDVELVLVGGLEFTQKYVKLVHYLQDDGLVDGLDPIQHVVDNVSTNHTATYANLGNIYKSFNNSDEYTFHYNFTLLSNNTTSLTFNTKVLESGGFSSSSLSCDSFMRIFIQPMSILT